MTLFEVAPGFRLNFLENSTIYTQHETQESDALAMDSRLPVVLLLHGLGASAESWNFQFSPLSKAGYRYIAIDFPGFGKSDDNPSNLSARLQPEVLSSLQSDRNYHGHTILSWLVEPVIALIEHFNIENLHVIGISLGGVAALQLALECPQRVQSLLLVNTFARLDLGNPKLWPYYLGRFILVHTLGIPTQARLVARRIFPHPGQEILRQALIDQICQANPQAYRRVIRSLPRINLLPYVPNIKAPSQVVTGLADTTVSITNQSTLAVALPNARHITVSDAGHAITAEKPAQFNQIMLDFLGHVLH